MSRKYAHKIPFIVKINHNELLTYPNRFDQIMFGTVKEAYEMGAAAVGATIYFGSDESGRQIVEVSQAFAQAHELGMATVLWCYLRNPAFKKDKDYHVSADLTGQANHLGVTIQADIIKQKLPENNGGYEALNMGDSSYGKFDKRIYTELSSDHPIDLCRYQVANCYMGRIGLINSGGASGQHDMADAVTTAVINKRAGGMGLISGRKAFQRPMKDGIALLNAIQDVYSNPRSRSLDGQFVTASGVFSLNFTPSHRATTAVARQLPSTFTDVRAMSRSVSMPSSSATPSAGRLNVATVPARITSAARGTPATPLLVSISVSIMTSCVPNGMWTSAA